MYNKEYVKIKSNKFLKNRLREEYNHLIVDNHNEFVNFNCKKGTMDSILIKITKEIKDTQLISFYRGGTSIYDHIFIWKYINGEKELLDISIDYMIKSFLAPNEQLKSKIEKELISFVKDVDEIEIYKDNKFYLNDNSDKNIIIELVIDDYLIIANKVGTTIKVNNITKTNEFILS